MVLAVVITLFYIGGYSSLFTFISPYLQQNSELSATALSGILLISGICGFAGSKFGGGLADTKGSRFTIYAGLSIQGNVAAVVLVQRLDLRCCSINHVMDSRHMGDISSTAVVFSYPGPAIAGYSLKRQYFVYQFGFALGSGIGGLVISSSSIDNLGWSGFVMVLVALLLAVRLLANDKITMTTLVTISRYDELKDDHLTSYPSNIELSFLERDESIMYTTVSDFITEWKRKLN